jgi:hypothetical protein
MCGWVTPPFIAFAIRSIMQMRDPTGVRPVRHDFAIHEIDHPLGVFCDIQFVRHHHDRCATLV